MFLSLFKSKNEEKLNFFSFIQVKNHFACFGCQNKMLNFFFLISIFFANVHFEGPVIKKMINLTRALGRNLPIFLNRTSKNIPDRQKCVGFQKSKKVLNHCTLMVQYSSSTSALLNMKIYLFRLLVISADNGKA